MKSKSTGQTTCEWPLPSLRTERRELNEAFRIALGDIVTNIVPFKSGLLGEPAPAIMAGLDYHDPWTRDAAINAWNGASLLFPRVSRDTLLSVIEKDKSGKVRIGGQYWDAIIWATGAWAHYLYTGDLKFLALAFEATRNSIRFFEDTEFDSETGLFCGPACYGDGIAAYPDEYANMQGRGGILHWPTYNSDKVSKHGYGISMKTLSTNCLYYNAYMVAEKMARILRKRPDPQWKKKAARLKQAINARLWNKAGNCYFYLLGPYGTCDHHEGLGHSFALLFGVADDCRADAVFKNQYVAPAGIPCVWPTFPRYADSAGTTYARHSGTVWPHVQGFWACAAADAGRREIFAHELFALARNAARDSDFREIYHPVTGEKYGGVQESRQGIEMTVSKRRQTWSATAYLRMVLMGLAGMSFHPAGLRFCPCIPQALQSVELSNLRYRNAVLDLAITGNGARIARMCINGKRARVPFVPARASGPLKIRIVMAQPSD